MTTAESLMQAVFARLEESPALCDNVRRAHRVPVTREKTPAIYLVDGRDEITGHAGSECQRDRRKRFTVSLFVRNDDGASAVDPLVEDVNDRLNPAVPYGNGITLHQGPITPAEEIADEDAIRIDLEFWFDYEAPGWSLS